MLLEMERLGIVLDVTHPDDGFWQALDIFRGPNWASHQNCRALAPHQRQFNDEQLKAIIERDAVIGIAFDAWMMAPDWQRGVTQPYTAGVSMERIIEHVDHICQLAGNTRHVGIGSDLDGGYGREQCPYDMETIADLRKLIDLLAKRGYSESDGEGMMHGNRIRRLNDIWS
jgi:membrane dipeptidase